MDTVWTVVMQRDFNHHRQLATTRPVSFIHQTVDGSVHLLVKPTKKGWESLHWGCRMGGAWTFETLAEANEHVLRWFEQVYEGHRCSSECRPVEAIAAHKCDDPWGLIREKSETS